jgi:hypothetical protein
MRYRETVLALSAMTAMTKLSIPGISLPAKEQICAIAFFNFEAGPPFISGAVLPLSCYPANLSQTYKNVGGILTRGMEVSNVSRMCVGQDPSRSTGG